MQINRRAAVGSFVWLFSLGLLGQTAFAATDDDIHISAIAEFYALQVYPQVAGHKAIAVGPGGYWAESVGRRSSRDAQKIALGKCEKALRTSRYKTLSTRHCILFDIDGKRTGKAVPQGIPFGTIAENPDKPLALGRKWEPSDRNRRGMLVFVGGCNKLDRVGDGSIPGYPIIVLWGSVS